MQTFVLHLNVRWRLALISAVVAIGALVALVLAGGQDRASAATATASGSKTVTIKNFSYKPGTLHVSPGTRVVWVNSDSTAHTATKGGSFSTGKIKPGHAAAVKFTSRGTYSYHCTIHPSMHGKIVVG